jgi:hypothetical protein
MTLPWKVFLACVSLAWIIAPCSCWSEHQSLANEEWRMPNAIALPTEVQLLVKPKDATKSSSDDDGPDGCCAQSNGTAIACSVGIKEKQCYQDCKLVGCTAKWHAGYCQLSDHCS